MAVAQTRSARPSWVAVRREGTAVALNILTTVLAITFMFPFLWAVSSSLKTAPEILAFPPRLLPRIPQFYNYAEAWESIQFGIFFANSTIVSVLSVVGQIVSSFVVAYGFARLRFPGREMPFAAHPMLFRVAAEEGSEGEDGAVLINPFEVPEDGDERFVSAWEQAGEWLGSQDGWLGRRLHQLSLIHI